MDYLEKILDEDVTIDNARRKCEQWKWYDNNYDEIRELFYNEEEFIDFVNNNILNGEPDKEMLNLLLRYNFNFIWLIEQFQYPKNLEKYKFIWAIDAGIVNNKEKNLSNLCSKLLENPTVNDVDKFKHAFNNGFPCKDGEILYVYNLTSATKIIEFSRKMGLNLICKYNSYKELNPVKLKFYIEWLKEYNLDDPYLEFYWPYFVEIGDNKILNILKNKWRINTEDIELDNLSIKSLKWLNDLVG